MITEHKPLARLGDVTTHGGVIVTANGGASLDGGRPVACIGDIVSCPCCGNTTIVSGSWNSLINGQPVARMGDYTACGGMIANGSEGISAGA